MSGPNPMRDTREGYQDLNDAMRGNKQGIRQRATNRANERAAEMDRSSREAMAARKAAAEAKAQRQKKVQRGHAYVEALLGRFGATPADISEYRRRAYPEDSEAMRSLRGRR